MAQSHWEDGNTKCLGMLVDGRAQKTGIRKHGADTSILTVMNSFAGWSTSHFRNAKAPNPGRCWPIPTCRQGILRLVSLSQNLSSYRPVASTFCSDVNVRHRPRAIKTYVVPAQELKAPLPINAASQRDFSAMRQGERYDRCIRNPTGDRYR
jgi:hypothetical protein